MESISFSPLRCLSSSVLIRENHVSAWSVTSIHQITLNLHIWSSHLRIIIHHLRSRSHSFHGWIWLRLRWHSSRCRLLLPVMCLLLTRFHEVLLSWLRSLRWISLWWHLLHHHWIHARHLLSCSHSHVLMLRWVVWITSSLLMSTNLTLWHHLYGLLRSASRRLGLLHVLHFQTLYTYNMTNLQIIVFLI